MRVKKYLVDSMPDALQKIRSELGKDAVIINTKEIKHGGFLGLFSKKKIEVIAATDTSSSSSRPQASSNEVKATAVASHANVARQSASAASIAVLQEKITEAMDHQPQPQQPIQSSIQPQLQPNTFKAAVSYERPVSTAKLPETKQILENQQLMAEMKQMKEMMRKIVTNQVLTEEVPEAIMKLEQRLITHEFETHLIDKIKQSVVDELEAKTLDITDEHVFKSARTALKRIIDSVDRKGISPDTRIAHFVGPTGVGKTTTIAKLAAEQVLKHKRQVGFITSDTYRIAAVEQLKTYANILNVPLEVVFSPQELTKAYDQLVDQELIFMDTAGRNYRNEMYVSELNSLLRNHNQSETYLVLSMTMKYKDMKAITENFAKFKIDKVLFTKLDETDSYGPIFNLIHDFSLPLSYVTNGQNVPDDIDRFDENLWIDHILEG